MYDQENFDPEAFTEALQRSEQAQFTNPDQRAAHKRSFARRLAKIGLPCIGRDTEARHMMISCGSCKITNHPDFFTGVLALPPPSQREDDPTLEMMDDPFITNWFHRLRTDQQEPIPAVAAAGILYSGTLKRTAKGRSFIITEEGLVGLVRSNAEVGDIVVIIASADTPFVVRRCQEGEGTARSFSLVGGGLCTWGNGLGRRSHWKTAKEQRSPFRRG